MFRQLSIGVMPGCTKFTHSMFQGNPMGIDEVNILQQSFWLLLLLWTSVQDRHLLPSYTAERRLHCCQIGNTLDGYRWKGQRVLAEFRLACTAMHNELENTEYPGRQRLVHQLPLTPQIRNFRFALTIWSGKTNNLLHCNKYMCTRRTVHCRPVLFNGAPYFKHWEHIKSVLLRDIRISQNGNKFRSIHHWHKALHDLWKMYHHIRYVNQSIYHTYMSIKLDSGCDTNLWKCLFRNRCV